MVTVKESVRVSVVMVTYNGGAYLRQQLDSVLAQLGEQDELVVSDDGSQDGTLLILQEYQTQNRKVRLLKGPGQGIKKNVEHAILAARGHYIFLADQDDIWLPGKVDRVLQVFEEQKASVVVHDAKVFQGRDNSQIFIDSFFTFRGSGAGVMKNITKNTYIGCCMAFRRELLKMILPIPVQIEMHDQWIGVLGDYFAGKSYFLPEALLLYRRHGENNSAMSHYGFCRMVRNRLVFIYHFGKRILYLRRKNLSIRIL